MRVTTFAPSSSLATYVRRFEIVEASEAATRTLLPESGIVLGIRYAGRAALVQEERPDEVLPQSTVTGMRTKVRRLRTSAGGGIVVVKFHPAGAAAFFGTPLHEIFGTMRPLTDWVVARDVERLEVRLAEAEDHPTRIALVEAFLLERVPRSPRTDPFVQAALAAIAETPEAIRVRALAQELGLSVDAFEKRFRRVVGCTPKQYASILRLRSAVARHRPDVRLTQLSHDAGFYDQAHFIQHFRAMAGISPGRFFAQERYC